MDTSDIIIMLDKKYSGAGAILCPHEGEEVTLPQSKYRSGEHGNLTVHGTGVRLVCGRCGYTTAADRV